MIGFRNERWVHFELDTFDIQLPLIGRTECTPIGCSLDFSATASVSVDVGRQVNPMPILNVLTRQGLLAPYHAVSFNPKHASLQKQAELRDVNKAQFGHPPPGYSAPSAMPVPPAVTPQKPAQTKPQPPPAPAQVPIKAEPKPDPAQQAAERERKEIETLDENFKRLVADYCKLRNAQAKKIDVLRALRDQAEECISSIDLGIYFSLKGSFMKIDILDELDELSNVVVDIQVSIDDAGIGLERLKTALLESTEMLSEMKILHSETKSEKHRDMSFSERKQNELLEDHYVKTLEAYATMKEKLEAALSTDERTSAVK